MKPIVVIDSGVGGLLAFREFLRTFANEYFIYLGDTKRAPYGDKSAVVVREYTRNMLQKALSFNPKMVVIACNTMEAAAPMELKRFEQTVPLVRIIEPTVKTVSALNPRSILVLATPRTVHSSCYPTLLRAYLPRAQVDQIACPMFVEYVEGKLTQIKAHQVVEEELGHIQKKYDVVLLGCTHYPYLAKNIRAHMNGSHVADSLTALTRELKRNGVAERKGAAQGEIYMSQCTPQAKQFIEKLWGNIAVREF